MRRLIPALVVALASLVICAGAQAQKLIGTAAQTFSPALAVSSSGRMLAAWFQGPAPCVSGGSYSCDTNWTGSKVVLAAGTTRDGFGRATVVSHKGNDGDNAVQVAESASGVGYVAWEEPSSQRAEIVTVRRGVVSRASPFLPKGVNQVLLLSSPGGDVAAVWSQYGHGDPVIRYGLLGPKGHVSHVVTILHTNPSVGANGAYSLGAHGRLAVAWVAGTATRMTTCAPAHGCAAPQTVVSDAGGGGVALALSPDGTVTVAAGGIASGTGVFAATEPFGGRLSKAVRLNTGGEQPTAAPVGSGGALVMFVPGPVPYTRLAWSMLGPSGFTSPVTLSDPDTIYSAALAGNTDGQFAAAWIDTVRPSGPSSLRLVLGGGGEFGAARTIVPASGSVNGLTPAIGIDGAGNAVVLWNRWSPAGRTYGPCGMYATIVKR